MSVWIAAKLPFKEWGPVQFRLLVLLQDMQSSLHVAMLRRPGLVHKEDDVYIVLPDAISALKFPEFIEISEHEIPRGLMMVGDEPTFRKRFPEVLLMGPDDV